MDFNGGGPRDEFGLDEGSDDVDEFDNSDGLFGF